MSAPIGVFDSGIGGLTVLMALRERLPGQGFLYLGDTANAPYGVRDAEDIVALTRAGIDRLFAAGCRLVILACNTAASVALRRIQTEGVPEGRRVLGVFVPVIEALTGRLWVDEAPPLRTGLASVVFFATPATVASGAFPRELALRSADTQVFAQACPGLVDALEAGDRAAADALARSAAGEVLVRCPAPGAAVLGCTHYPLVEAAFRAALPQGTRVLSQPEITAARLADYLARHPEFDAAGAPSCCLTTGDAARVSARATQFLGNSIEFRSA